MIHKIIYSFIVVYLMCSCSCSDCTITINSDYSYGFESKELQDILHSPGDNDIPATVVDFAYNQNFIIAKQKPLLPQDIRYPKQYEYKEGTDRLYYWLILLRNDSLMGPLNEGDFLREVIKHKVPFYLEWHFSGQPFIKEFRVK